VSRGRGGTGTRSRPSMAAGGQPATGKKRGAGGWALAAAGKERGVAVEKRENAGGTIVPAAGCTVAPVAGVGGMLNLA
jgi:hypothetical protein